MKAVVFLNMFSFAQKTGPTGSTGRPQLQLPVSPAEAQEVDKSLRILEELPPQR